MKRDRKISRRSLLAGGLGLAAAYAAGCGGDDDGDAPARTPTMAAPASPTPAATSPAPTPPPASSPAISARWGRLPAVGNLPPGRRDMSLVSSGETLYVFGGRNPDPLGDFWTCDLQSLQWSEIKAPGPEARFGHNAVFEARRVAVAPNIDGARIHIVVFGGQAAGFFNDTWRYSFQEGAWARLDPGSGPSPRYGAASAYDPAGRMIVSHGFTGSGRFDDTWSFDLAANAWSGQTPGGARPLERCLTRGAWDSANERFLLFGGQSNAAPFLGDFWQLTADGWSELPGGPPPRNLYAMAYDEANRRLVLFGGAGEDGNMNDAWIFDAAADTWTQIVTAGEPPSPRAGHDAVWLPERNALIVFGGFDGAYQNDLWQLEFA